MAARHRNPFIGLHRRSSAPEDLSVPIRTLAMAPGAQARMLPALPPEAQLASASRNVRRYALGDVRT